MELRCGTIQRFTVISWLLMHISIDCQTEFRLLQNRFAFDCFRPVHGLIFLFKYVQDDEPAGAVVRDSRLEKIFFAKQVIMPTK